MRRLTAPAAGVLVGALTGIADAVMLVSNFFGARPPGGYSLAMLAAVVWTWATVCCATGVVFSSPRLGRLRGAALMAVGPGLLLLARCAMPLKFATGFSAPATFLAWGVATLVLCAIGMLIPLAEGRRGRWAIVAFASLALVMLSAADVVRMPRRSSKATAQGRNVVLIVLDTARYDDTFVAAPNIAAFARGAVTFDNAWSPGAWTTPSHFAMFTGRDPWTVPFDGESYVYDGAWIGERFRSRGYETAGVFSNNRLTDHDGFGRGFDELTFSRQAYVCRSGLGSILAYSPQFTGRTPPLCERMVASEIAGRARNFLRRARRPYFLAMNFIDPHDPYVIEPECLDAATTIALRAERKSVVAGRPVDPRVLARVREQYRSAMRCMDRSIGALLREVDDGRTVIAITSDHGEHFGEHGLGGHGHSAYRELLHVPLILKVPGVPPARVADSVSTADLYESLIRAADPARARGPIPLLESRLRRAAVSSFEVVGTNRGFSVARGNVQLIRYHDGREELFGQTDPRTVASMRETLLRAARGSQRRADFHALGYLR